MTLTRTTRADFPTCDDFPELTGKQSPLHLREAAGFHEHGRKCVELGKRAGVVAMPWQRHEIAAINATDGEGRWVHSDAILICPRQNGKSLLVALIVLYRVFVLGQNVLFTAQRWETAKELWEHTWRLVQGRKFLLRKVTSKSCSQGRGTIFAANGGRVVFTTRSQDAGRGLTKVDLLVYDEAYNLTDGEMAALSFLSQAAPDPQVFYMSSSVHRDFSQHANGRVLSSIRAQALGDWDEAEPIYLSEYAAEPSCDPTARGTWRMANPSFGVIATEKKMQRIMRRMSTEVGRINFGVEALGWGLWFDESEGEDGFVPIIDPADWVARVDRAPQVTGDACMAVDVTPDGRTVGVVAAVRTAAGVHLSLSPMSAFDRDEVVGQIRRAVGANDPLAVVLDPKGPASTLVDPLAKAGVDTEHAGFRQVVEATELLMRLWAEGKVTHDGDPRWESALEVAEFRTGKEGGRALTRSSGVVCQLVAATLAVWGLTEFEIPAKPQVKTKKRFTGAAKPVKAARRAPQMAF